MKGYELSRFIFNWAFDNPDLIKPPHISIYFFAVEHCNRLQWPVKFRFPTEMAMSATGIRNYKTYSKHFEDLAHWNLITIHERAKNQYSSNIIALVKNTKATSKALPKALDKAMLKHSMEHGPEQVQSIDSYIKPKTENLKPKTENNTPPQSENDLFKELGQNNNQMGAKGKIRQYVSEKGYMWSQSTDSATDFLIKKINKKIAADRKAITGIPHRPSESEIYDFFITMAESSNWHVLNNWSIATLNDKFSQIVEAFKVPSVPNNTAKEAAKGMNPMELMEGINKQ